MYKGKCRQKDVAVKVLLKQDYDEKTLEAFRHEVEVMRYESFQNHLTKDV